MSKINFFYDPPLSEYHPAILPVVKILKPNRIVETGIKKGILSEKLLHLVEKVDGELLCIDLYTWHEDFKKLVGTSPSLNWIHDLPQNALKSIEPSDLYIFDDDYNYFAVSEELRLSWELNSKEQRPFMAIVQGVSWPFSQRDAYHIPENIPTAYLKPHTWNSGVVVDNPNTVKNGFRIATMALALQEGGEKNGVLPAIWDFLKDKKEKLNHIKIPGFFGLSFIYSVDAPWSEEVTKLLSIHRNNVLLDQMEEVRLSLAIESRRMQYDRDTFNIHRQNGSFDIDNFCRKISEGKGKKEKLGTVSIIMPTRNRPKLLSEAIQSAINQTYKDIEIVVINDGDQDLQPLLNQWNDPRITYIPLSIHNGVSAARNIGLKMAKGKYIAYLDDDDIYYPHHIETLVNGLSESGFSVAYSDHFRVSRREDNGKIVTFQKRLTKCINMDLDTLLVDIEVPPVCFMHEKTCLEKVGDFDETLTRYEDWDLYLRLIQEYQFLHIPIPTAEYVITIGYQQTITHWGGFFLNALLKIHGRYKHLAEDKPSVRALQAAFREKSRYGAFLQLERMDQFQSDQLGLEKIMKEIIDHSSQNTDDDIRGANALLWHMANRYPDNLKLKNLINQYPYAKAQKENYS